MSETTSTDATPDETEILDQAEASLVAAQQAHAQTQIVRANGVQNGINNWMNKYIRGSVIAQNTPAWNYLQSQLANLRDMITKEI